jgi:capsular exopolysaccharide synthesis family protein
MVSDPAKLKQLVQAERAKGGYITGRNESFRLREELGRLQLQLADRTRQVNPNHPAAQAVQEKIEQVQVQLAELDSQFADVQLAVARQQYLACKERETEVNAYFMEQRQKALNLNEQLAQYTILQSGWEQTKKLCDILDDRIKELNITEDVGALNISVLEIARPADKPSKPQKARTMAMALVLGLMFGGGLALLRDWMDQKLRSPEEINAVLGIPVLGSVPLMSRRQSICDRGQKVLLESDSPAAEAYRSIRTAVFFGAPNGQAKTVLVTSPAASDGKTTLVSNLAITMAQAGQKTLILDADLRKPMQHEIFGLDCDSGLTTVLASKASLKDAIHPTEVKNLDILTTGPNVPNPSELLNSTAFARTLAELAADYDRVIIDSPPVMPVTDARILAALCNVTVLVLRAEESTRKTSQQACDGLLSVGAQLLGTVVNEVSKGNGQYGCYTGYGYGHYSHSRNKNKTAKTYSEKDSPKS